MKENLDTLLKTVVLPNIAITAADVEEYEDSP